MTDAVPSWARYGYLEDWFLEEDMLARLGCSPDDVAELVAHLISLRHLVVDNDNSYDIFPKYVGNAQIAEFKAMTDAVEAVNESGMERIALVAVVLHQKDFWNYFIYWFDNKRFDHINSRMKELHSVFIANSGGWREALTAVHLMDMWRDDSKQFDYNYSKTEAEFVVSALKEFGDNSAEFASFYKNEVYDFELVSKLVSSGIDFDLFTSTQVA